MKQTQPKIKVSFITWLQIFGSQWLPEGMLRCFATSEMHAQLDSYLVIEMADHCNIITFTIIK